jgi:hypothetical protein
MALTDQGSGSETMPPGEVHRWRLTLRYYDLQVRTAVSWRTHLNVTITGVCAWFVPDQVDEGVFTC